MTGPIDRSLARSIMGASGDILRILDNICEKRKLTYLQFTILEVLANAGPEGMPRSEIRKNMSWRRFTDTTRISDVLEENEFIRSTRSKKDRRYVYNTITPKGTKLYVDLRDEVYHALEYFFGGLDKESALTAMQAIQRKVDRSPSCVPTDVALKTESNLRS